MKFKPAKSPPAKRSADFQSAVSPNCIRLGVAFCAAGGLQIRDTADCKSALRRRSGAFTLAEVLAALLFMAIVIPVAVQGLRIASRTGSVSEQKAVGARLAERKLNELIVTGQWQSAAQKGTVKEGLRSYSWWCQSEPWVEDAAMRLVTVHVNVPVQGQDYDVHVGTLVDGTQ